LASSILRLSVFLGKIPPEAFDAIFPHGPILSHRAAELNPQPLPPKQQLLVASAAVAHDIAHAAVIAEAAGSGSPAKLVARAVDDWCGTRPRPLPIPWPGPWPFPWPPEPEPHPDWDIGLSRVVGALTLASVASRLDEGELQDALAKGAEQLLEAGLNT
jgi:hypothetical protein